MRLGKRQNLRRTAGIAVAASVTVVSLAPALMAPAGSNTTTTNPNGTAPAAAELAAAPTSAAPEPSPEPTPAAAQETAPAETAPPPTDAPEPPPTDAQEPPPTEAPEPATTVARPKAGLVQPTTPTTQPTQPKAGLVQPPGLVQPSAPPPSDSRNEPAGPPSPGSSSSAETSRGGGPDSAEFLRLLQESAARRRHLDGRVSELEGRVTNLEVQQQAADAAVVTAESDERAMVGQLEKTTADLRRAQQAVWTALFPAPDTARGPVGAGAAADPSGLGRSPLDRRAVGRAATAAPAPPVVGPTPGDMATAVRAERALRGRVMIEKQLVQQARALAGEVRYKAATAAQVLEAERQALGSLRQELSAALVDPTALAQGSALTSGVEPSARARSEIPAEILALYQEAAKTCPGLSWSVLAAIGSIESAHGKSMAEGVHSGQNFAGAQGPMQFLRPSWEAYGVDGDRDGDRDVYDSTDAIFGAANYLCRHGAGDPGRLPDAIWAYNHADWYVDDVLVLAFRYSVGGLEPGAGADVNKLLANPNLTLTPNARADLANGVVDPRVVSVLAAAAANHKLSVSVFQTGHSQFVAGTDHVSNHFYGRAVDIYAVDGAPVSPSNDAALDLSIAILTGSPELQPDEFGSPWAGLSQFPGAFTDAGHQDHLHIGWD